MPAELFAALAPTPLAERLRPKTLGDILGQEHLLGPEGPLGRMLAARKLSSAILWGRATTKGRVILEVSRSKRFRSGVKDINGKPLTDDEGKPCGPFVIPYVP